jgi:cell division protein FtsL
MMPAEKRYPSYYQDSYKRYGSSLRPEEPKAPRPVQKKETVSRRDKNMLLLLIILAGIVGVGVIIATTYEIVIKYEINQIDRETAALYGEIENLDVKIKSGASIGVVEQRAQEELGMIYPTADQFVFLTEAPAPVRDFAQYIRENAYQIW